MLLRGKLLKNNTNASEFPMPKIVLDLNVLIAALLSDKGSSYELVHLCAEGKVTGYVSKTMMSKFNEVIQRDYKVPLERAEQMVEVLLQFLKLVEPDFKLKAVAEDDEDNRVVECAVYTKADYLASWDPHLTNLKEFQGIKIMNPGKLLEELKEGNRIK
ncbi:MAG TPA: putative toxin-antitoxin system toxin component, PIN family [Candidatus Norongarragalinales archaeon]|nr:putative toxin-antitoxin system toxin component, PIN family [Candidatus Norongarragalinales archaeon]